MTARPAFKLTARQAQDLVNVTPPGYVAELRIAFVPAQDIPWPEKKRGGDECDGVFGTEQSD